MNTIREALIKSGLIRPADIKVVKLKPVRKKRKSRFSGREIRHEMAVSQRLPSASGSVAHEARLRSAAGSDGHRVLKVTPNDRLK